MSYNKLYTENENVFGEAEDGLKNYFHLIDKKNPVLDIGAGQGRNSVFLAQRDFDVVAIDTPDVAIETIDELSESLDLKITAIKKDIRAIENDKKFSAILIYGLLQILKWDDIFEVIEKIDECTYKDSLIFISAWTVEDPSFKKWKLNHERIGKNSFLNLDGEVRTFFERNEILELFNKHEVIYHWEGLGEKHSHGNGIFEQHGRVELILRKK